MMGWSCWCGEYSHVCGAITSGHSSIPSCVMVDVELMLRFAVVGLVGGEGVGGAEVV